ncbi:transcriptional regulator BetI [Methylobacterium terricola]|uniref:Transcriptional regulator BetI n=1 Tax=Methylobacterium terricola TaxID=2583531 RepID=A0A5C4LI98_9HYPH|nr:transcriptional regulator BetI [Methylobacterium terricola]TNC12885.1 transcriptional regulator BetI [Methylobacterium terricola]
MTQANLLQAPAMQTFEAARRRHLVEATIETLAEVGFKAASLSEIARRANVSTGLFAHYFGDKDGLLEATLRFMAARLAAATAGRLAASRNGRERLYAVCDAALADEEFDRRTSAVWLAFWGQMAHSQRYQRVQAIYQRRMISNLRHGLRGLVPEARVARDATMIAAMIDGLWLRSHVAQATKACSHAATAAPGEAGADGAALRAVVHAFIDDLLAGPSRAAAPAPGDRDAAAPEAVRHRSPVTGAEIARFLPAREAEIRGAVAGARAGLRSWRAAGGPGRAPILSRCAQLLRAEGADLARLEAGETGRPVRQIAGIDLPQAIRLLDHAAALAEANAAVHVELGLGRLGRRSREALGLVAASGHWSAALLGLCDQAAALACGNAVLYAADPGATRTSAAVADLFARAGLPDGALTVLRGDRETARLLRAHPGLVPAPCEAWDALDLGAGLGVDKTATIVLPGADVDRAAAAVLHGHGTWLRSTFPSQTRLHVHAGMRDALRDALRVAAAALRVGDPLDPGTQIGPAHSAAQAAGLATALRADLAAGADLVVGEAGAASSAGAPPLVLDLCRDDMALVRGHGFAPVVTLEPFEDEAALAARIGGPALRAGILAGDPERAWRLALALDGAFCAINPPGMSRDGAGPPGTSSAFADWSVAVRPDHVPSRIARIVGPGRSPAA